MDGRTIGNPTTDGNHPAATIGGSMNHDIMTGLNPVKEALDAGAKREEHDRLHEQWRQVGNMISHAGDGWHEIAAPFISCARMALGDDGAVIRTGLVSAEAGILLQTMIPSACTWMAETGGTPDFGIIMHGDTDHGTASLWTRIGRDAIIAGLPDGDDTPAQPTDGEGKSTDSIGRALQAGHAWAARTAARTMLMLPILERIIPTDADMLLEDTIWRSTSWYEHVIHMLTALAEGMSRSTDLAHVRLHTALLTGGGWDPAFEQGVEDRITPQTAAAYDTGRDLTLWVADIIEGLHSHDSPLWPAEAGDAQDLTGKACRIVTEWNRFDPGARLTYLQYPGTLILNALGEAPVPAFEGEAHMLNTLIRMIRITPDHTLKTLENGLTQGDAGLLRLMFDQPDAPLADTVAGMVAACGREADTETFPKVPRTVTIRIHTEQDITASTTGHDGGHAPGIGNDDGRAGSRRP